MQFFFVYSTQYADLNTMVMDADNSAMGIV